MSNKSEIYNRIKLFIERGKEIKEQNDKKDDELENSGMLPLMEIGGSEYRIWLNEINTFCERHLKKHPLYRSIHDCYFFKDSKSSTFEDMMGILQALSNDDEFFNQIDNDNVHSESATTKKEVLVLSNSKIFISHRSVDKEIADSIQDFLIALGVNRDMVFCSSLPGSDVKQKISTEIKSALENSCLNIVILSRDYYDSAYCLNEAGVLWFLNTPVVPIAMPEIDCDNMIGFLGNEYKIRRLDNDVDLAYINDCLCEIGIIKSSKATVLNQETKKLISRYMQCIEKRLLTHEEKSFITLAQTTDDEKVLLYYIINHKLQKIRKFDVEKWLIESEIHNVNIDNAFDLFVASGLGKFEEQRLNININAFRSLVTFNDDEYCEYSRVVRSHTKYSSDSFLEKWSHDELNDEMLLFISYIIDEKVFSFGDRWMATGQLESIKNWEKKNGLYPHLSETYDSCLSFFIENKWVYPSDFTKYGNPREYTLYKSLNWLLLEDNDKLEEDKFEMVITNIKNKFKETLPF